MVKVEKFDAQQQQQQQTNSTEQSSQQQQQNDDTQTPNINTQTERRNRTNNGGQVDDNDDSVDESYEEEDCDDEQDTYGNNNINMYKNNEKRLRMIEDDADIHDSTQKCPTKMDTTDVQTQQQQQQQQQKPDFRNNNNTTPSTIQSSISANNDDQIDMDNLKTMSLHLIHKFKTFKNSNTITPLKKINEIMDYSELNEIIKHPSNTKNSSKFNKQSNNDNESSSNNMNYAPVSPPLTNCDKSPLQSDMLMHHLDDDHALSSSALSTSSSSLIRTSSNASSSSSNNNDPSNLNDQHCFATPPASAGMLMFNENQLKKLIMGNNAIDNYNNGNLSAVAAAVADKFAYIIRSRSSSSESSANNFNDLLPNKYSSLINNDLLSMQYQQNQANEKILSNYFKGMPPIPSQNSSNNLLNNGTASQDQINKQDSQASSSSVATSSISNDQIGTPEKSNMDSTKPPLDNHSLYSKSNLNAPTLMKQMINSYQSAIGGQNICQPNNNSNIEFNNSIIQQQKQAKLKDSPSNERKSSSSLLVTANNMPSTASNNQNENCNGASLPSVASSQSLLNAEMDEAKNEEIKAKINAVANKIGCSGTTTTPSLCKVCGDEASGFHYGVDSCEGCKGFFRRCITQGMNHQCTNNQQCEITAFSRNSCQFCRLKKCFAVGMSREASRLGRRPKRPRDENNSSFTSNSQQSTPSSKQVHNNDSQHSCDTPPRSMKEQNKHVSDQTAGQKSNETAKSLSNGGEIELKENKKQQINQHKDSYPLSTNAIMDLSAISSSLDAIPQPPFKLETSIEQQQQQQQQQKATESMQPASSTTGNINKPKMGSKSNLLTFIKDEDMRDDNKMTTNNFEKDQHEINTTNTNNESNQQLATPQTNTNNNNNNNQSTINNTLLMNLIERADRYLSFDRISYLEYIRYNIIEAYNLFWPTTSEKIQIKHREKTPTKMINMFSNTSESTWTKSVEAIVPLIMDVVKCCKYIPGFSDLSQHDQVQLLKQGSFEVICVNSFNLVDVKQKLMLTHDLEYLMDCSTIRTMPLGFFMIDVFELSIQVSNLKLTDQDIALLNAVLVINPNRENLCDRSKIQELQGTLLHVLYRHMKQSRPDDPSIFLKILKLIPSIETLNQKHAEALNKLQMNT